MSDLLTRTEAARYLRRSVRWLEAHSKEIPHYRVGRRSLYRKGELDRWLDDHRVGVMS